jgi:ergothioneine biosynthesis protein EgtB
MSRKRHPSAGSRTVPSRADIDPLAELFRSVRTVTQRLAAPLSPEDCMVQSMADASPVKWHLAHTTWFFETFVLERYASGYRPFHPAFRVLFNSYYNTVGDKHPRPERGLLTRPQLAEILEYRAYVDERVLALLGNTHGISPECLGLVTLGVNHEEQHQELILTDIKHLLSKSPLEPAYSERWPLVPVRPARSRWVGFPGGEFEIGHTGPAFAFDNETPRHRLLLQPFELASHPVTYGQFATFIEDGGYRRPELWLSLGWDTVQAQGWQAPLYWAKRDGQWTTFTLHGRVVIEPHTPVCHLSYFEADAYARWAEARLPTEAEWETAAGTAIVHANFLESGALHPLAPQREPAAGGLTQIYGDVWEWTRSGYEPYPGYRPAPGAVGEYNAKFMCSQYVLRGGSCATPKRHIRPSYRNFFPPEARWQFSGLRLARDA